MPFTQLLYHLVWRTKDSEPLIFPDLEPTVHRFIRSKAVGLGGTVFEIGGVEDHVHLLTTIPARLAVARFVGQVKGASSRRLKEHRPDFAWQAEYGAFTFGTERLDPMVAYVRNQREHHRTGRLVEVWERAEEEPWSDDGRRPMPGGEPPG